MLSRRRFVQTLVGGVAIAGTIDALAQLPAPGPGTGPYGPIMPGGSGEQPWNWKFLSWKMASATTRQMLFAVCNHGLQVFYSALVDNQRVHPLSSSSGMIALLPTPTLMIQLSASGSTLVPNDEGAPVTIFRNVPLGGRMAFSFKDSKKAVCIQGTLVTTVIKAPAGQSPGEFTLAVE